MRIEFFSNQEISEHATISFLRNPFSVITSISYVCINRVSEETKVHVVQTERTAAEEPKGKQALQDRKDLEEQRGRQEVEELTDWLGNAVPPGKLDHEELVVLPENLDPW